MSLRRTFRNARLRATALIVAAALAAPVVQPSAALAGTERPRYTGSGAVDDALLVTLRPGVGSTDAAQVLARARATELDRVDVNGIRVVSVPKLQRNLARRVLLADPRVASVEDDAVASAAVTPSDPYWPQQWGARLIRASEAWNATRGDSRVVIAIVDTGVDPTQPDLRGRVLPGWDFVNNDARPNDDDSHGTAVATAAAASGNDGVGIAGMCWRCRILPVKVLNGNGHGTHSNIAAGVVWAADHGADVINLSIAGLSSTALLRGAIAYALNRGAIVVAAAGNNGTSRRSYPAAYPGVVSVAATTPLDRLYSWSNRGSWVTLAAPGCAFVGRPGARWTSLCGTSIAAPIVSGTLGLMRSLAPRMGRIRLTSMLLNNTQRLRVSLAHGRLDAARAMRSVLATVPNPTADPTPKPTPTPTVRPTPTPTTKPTPSPTSKPTPSPSPSPSPTSTPPRHGDYVWHGTLGGNDRWDREQFWLRGHVHVNVEWWGSRELSIWVVNAGDEVMVHRHGDEIYFEMDLPAGLYQFTVQQDGSDQVSYKVEIEYGI